jgi:hypothetical protein
MKNVKNYPSTPIDQNKLHILSQKIMERFEEIMSCLGIELKKQKRFWVGKCPIHGGDKFNAVNIYHTGSIVGNWKCRTAQCEKYFVGSIIGFIRGVLSHNKYGWLGPGDKMVTFAETLNFISKCLNEDYQSIEIDFVALEKTRFNNNISLLNRQLQKGNGKTRANIRTEINIPAEYFIKRGYNKDILDKYDVGLCDDPRDLINFNRVVVPIYDIEHKSTVGNTSRSIFEKCPKCNTWHNPKHKCPREEESYKYAKWRHSSGFKKDECLYNYWFAKDHIKDTQVAILTESPGNVWRFEEVGIPVSLGTFGASFGDGQLYLLNRTGALTIITAMDNDEAGQRCAADIASVCKNTYKIYNFIPLSNDIGEMTNDEINEKFRPLYNSCVKEWML